MHLLHHTLSPDYPYLGGTNAIFTYIYINLYSIHATFQYGNVSTHHSLQKKVK